MATSANGVTYRVRCPEPARQVFEVEVSAEVAGATELVFPSWIPGSYLLRDYARHVRRASATLDGKSIEIAKPGHDRWRVDAGPGRLVAQFDVFAGDESVRGAYLHSRRGFFNGTCLFPWLDPGVGGACELAIEPPPGRDWHVATSLTPVEIDARGAGTYRAEDYDALIDHPVEMGRFERLEFTAGGTPHELVVAGHHQGDLERLRTDLAQICQAQIDFFGGLPPMDRYVFLALATTNGYGGLEHRSSTALIFSRDDLPVAGKTKQSADYQRLLGLCSHEYFHTWWVKQVKPEAFLPYDLTRRMPTELLWVFEGFTTYYQDLMLLRAGVISTKSYLARLAETLTRVYRTPGRALMPLAQSSLEAWDKLYKPTADSLNSAVSYYAKGAYVALALDLLLRQSGSSLDAIVLALWQRTRDQGAGVADDDVQRLATELAGRNLSDFFAQALLGTDDLDLAGPLTSFGVEMTLRPKVGDKDSGGREVSPDKWPTVGLGLDVADSGGRLIVQRVTSAGTAAAAGIAPGDELVAIDGARARPGELKRFEPGAPVTFSVFRDDVLLPLSAHWQPPPADTCVLKLAKDAGPEALALRAAWLGE